MKYLSIILTLLFLATPIAADEKQDATTFASSALGLIDKGKFAKLYKHAAPVLIKAVTEAQLSQGIRSANSAVGARKSRKRAKVTQHKDLGGFPGVYYVVRYESSYANLPKAAELLTVTQTDGNWTFAGYQVLKRSAVPAGF